MSKSWFVCIFNADEKYEFYVSNFGNNGSPNSVSFEEKNLCLITYWELKPKNVIENGGTREFAL